jgi:methylenetetrahydrofolate reductase (NADPH)
MEWGQSIRICFCDCKIMLQMQGCPSCTLAAEYFQTVAPGAGSVGDWFFLAPTSSGKIHALEITVLIIDKIRSRIEQKKPFYSFEYFPPKTDVGVYNLYPRIERMARLEPAFADITWGAGGSTSEKTLAIAENLQKFFGLDMMMHLTCTDMSIEELDQILDRAWAAGIRNFLALRGDPPLEHGSWEQVEGGFSYAHELVAHIRGRFGDEVCLAVAGYPEGHAEAPDVQTCVEHLKHKIDAGADFVITQLFFEIDEYTAFLDRCQTAGITCPILPGLMPIQSYDRFEKFVHFTGVKVPDEVWRRLDPIRQDDAEVRSYGVELCIQMCQRLAKLGVPGFHFYTLNLQSSVTRILEGLRFFDAPALDRALPWRPSTFPTRRQEDVRPIFWSNRPRSYLARTQDWDEFPNGRWGDRGSPSFGNLHDYYLLQRGMGLASREKKLRKVFGTPTTYEDVYDVFARFCSGEIKVFPWADEGLQAETGRIVEDLVNMNRAGYLTVNSQPQVSGVPSEDPVVGWGGAGGIVYQKAYLELFLSEQKLERFLARVGQFPSLSYQAVNHAGDRHTNLPTDAVSALTWGIFPGREVIQPTVVDCETFLIWKEEAFAIWQREWAFLYPEGSPSRKLLEEIQGSYWLLNLVENDFRGGDIFSIFRRMGNPFS